LDFHIALKGVIIGLLISIPLGPIGVLIIQRTLNKGFISGIFSGLGAAVVDVIYAFMAGFGVSIIIDFINRHEFYIQILASIILTALGLHIYINTTVKKLRAKQLKSNSYVKDFFTVFGITFTNPLTLLVFLGIFAGTSILGTDPTFNIMVIAAFFIFCGCMAWWVILSILASLFRRKFGFRQLFWMNKITGLILIIIGVLVLITSFFPILKYFN